MNNKENIPFWSSPPKWQPSQLTFSAKPCKRYGLKDILQSPNSSMQASSIKPRGGKQSMQFPQQLCDKSSLALSIRDKFNSRHLNSVHELIALARQKKSDIEDLLRSEEYKAQNQDQDSLQLNTSLRKLKKVVRLLEIVCKMINGKQKRNENEQNSNFNIESSSIGSAYPQQDIFSHQIYQQKVENLQHELQVKSCEIKRLKKLVELLSVPQKSQSKGERQLIQEQEENVNNYEDQEAKTCSILNISEQNEEDIICDIGTQSQEQLHITKKLSKKLRQSRLEFVNVFSFWTLFEQKEQSSFDKMSPIKNQSLDEKKHQKQIEEESQTVRNSFKYQTNNPSTFVSNHWRQKFNIFSYPVMLGIDGRANYLKRFKSVVKIAMNSLNLCLRFLNNQKTNAKIHALNEKLSKFALYFNENYHITNGVYSEDFAKQVKFKLKEVYDEAQEILLATL